MASPPAELAVRPGTPVKVAVVSPYAVDQPGGVQDQVMEISLRLAGHGIESWVVAPGLSGPPGARLVGRALTVPANGSRAPIAKPSGRINSTLCSRHNSEAALR